MNCKTCQDRGMLLRMSEASIPSEVKDMFPGENTITALTAVACDCCGGWSKDGKECENCKADAEGRPRPIMWVSDKEYPAAAAHYKEQTGKEPE